MKSIFIKVTLCISLMFAMASTVFAQNQTQTAYEKKVFEIKKNYVKKILIQNESWTRQSEIELYCAGEDYINAALALGILTAPDLIKSLESDLKAAEKLKTSVDFQREALEKYYSSDRGTIQKNIKSAFQAWNQKGEFEKQADYEERLKSQSQSRFVEICIEKIKAKINSVGNYDSRLEKELLKYDSENEVFPVSFQFNGVKWTTNFKIPISNAEDFKENFDDLRWQKNEYDWCFVENSLFPTNITLQNNDKKYSFDLSWENVEDIFIPFEALEVENPYLTNVVFAYSTAKEMDIEIARQKQVSDSVEFVGYTNKLLELANYYNQQLLQNPYNIEKKNMRDFNPVIDLSLNKNYGNKEHLERDFEDKSNAIKSKFENVSRYLKNEYDSKKEREHLTNGKLFADKAEFDSFFDKGSEIYKAELEKRQIFSALNKNKDIIETMDLQKQGTNETNILSIINNSKSKDYYAQVIDLVVETNKKLNTESSKNSKYFESKVEFYESFISGNYKDILKTKKKK